MAKNYKAYALSAETMGHGLDAALGGDYDVRYEMLAHSDFGATSLKAGDQLAFLYFMGGGARGRGGVA